MNSDQVRDAREYSFTGVTDILLRYDLGTVEGIAAGAAALERLLPGYVTPAAHGTGTLSADGVITVEMFNRRGHDFPALILAAVCGYRRGTEALLLSPDQLRLAIRVMEPASRCPAYRHPNIAAWRQILSRAELDAGIRVLAVFISEDSSPEPNPIVAAFRAAE